MDKSSDEFGLFLKWQDEIYEEALIYEETTKGSCGRRIGPYPCCTVIEGDCLELMKALPDGCVDAVITDPPYGINAARDRNSQKYGWTDHPGSGWDKQRPKQEIFTEILRISCNQCIWGGQYFADYLPVHSKWFIWDKGQEDFSLADCELAWTSMNGAVRRLEYSRGAARQDGKVHHTQKPLKVMLWNVTQMNHPNTILDPFCGSGTTLVAAKKLGCHFLGFEISPEYCTIARRRLAEVDTQPCLFERIPRQLMLSITVPEEAAVRSDRHTRHDSVSDRNSFGNADLGE